MVAVFLGCALGGETIPSRIVLAAMVIVAGVAIVTFAARKEMGRDRPAEIATAAVCEKPAAACCASSRVRLG